MTAETEVYYDPCGAAAELWDCEAPEVLIEGPAGTGKTRAVLEKLVALCDEYPGIRCLIARGTRTSLTESVLVTLETKVLWPGHPAMSGDASRANRHSYDFPNGSTIVTGGLDKPERLYSTEWDLVYVAEATEITEDAWEKFARAMRNHVLPYQQRIADCNPGAPGHWLNQRAKRGAMVRLKSRHEDNPSVTPDYLETLRSLSGHRRARLYEGRWVAAEGGVFPEFQEGIHTCPAFVVPNDWPWYVWWDPGYQHPTAIIWAIVSPNGRIYFADEIVQAGRSVEQHCAEFTKRVAGRNVQKVYGDPHHAFNRTAQSPVTIAEQAAKCGVNMIPGPSCRNAAEIESQVNMVRAGLTTNLKDGSPRIVVFETCQRTIWGFQTWSYKRNADGSIPGGDDRFEDIDDDEMDCVRGIVASNPTFTVPRIKVY